MICESYLSALKTGLDTKVRDDIVHRILPDYKYYPLHREDQDFLMEFIGHDKKEEVQGCIFPCSGRLERQFPENPVNLVNHRIH